MVNQVSTPQIHAENDDTNPFIQVPEGTAGSMIFIESTYGDLSDRQSEKSLQVSGRRVTAVAWCVFVLTVSGLQLCVP